MSLKETKEEAEAVLDSAEMTLETFPAGGETRRELERKIVELEQELQDTDSESELKKLIKDIRQLMEDIQEEGVEEPMEPGMEMGGGIDEVPPDDDVPPF